jgi:hypothetical protein
MLDKVRTIYVKNSSRIPLVLVCYAIAIGPYSHLREVSVTKEDYPRID